MKGDKDTSVVTLNKTDYTEKLENMVKEGIGKGRYCSEGNSEKNPSLITTKYIFPLIKYSDIDFLYIQNLSKYF